MINMSIWEPRFKACSAVAAIFSTIGLIAGGIFGLYTYHQQGVAADIMKEKELRLMYFNQKKDVYYELVEAAAAVAASPTKEDGIKNAARYQTLYFGRAHIFAIDSSVREAKIKFYTAMIRVMETRNFPTHDLDGASLELSAACKDVLRVQDIFNDSHVK